MIVQHRRRVQRSSLRARVQIGFEPEMTSGFCDLQSSTGSGRQTHEPASPLRPIADISSFDDLVGRLLKVHWHIDTDCRGSFEVDREIELLWPLYRQGIWLGTA